MGDTAISVRGLGKRYRIRYGPPPDRTLRGRLSSLISGEGRKSRPDQRQPEEYLWAIQDMSFEVSAGEVVGIIGRNGVGKSTLLKILARITEPTTGEADLYGRVSALLEVGTGFHGELTGRENIFLSGAILGMQRSEVIRRFDEIVAFSELEKFLDVPVKRYSSGMYVRLGFAVAAHLNPDILLVDEVLAVGDLAFQRRCLGRMSDVAQEGRTVLFVSHQMTSIRRLCSSTMWFDGGRIRAVGPTGEVVARYESESLGAAGPTTSEGPRGYQARYLSWRLKGGGTQDPHVISTLDPVAFELELDVGQKVQAGYGGFELFDLNGQLIWSGSTHDEERGDLQLSPGRYLFEFHLPNLPLRPAAYRLHASLYEADGHRLLDDWWAMPELIVATSPQSHPQDDWQGVLNLPFQFRVVPCEGPSAASPSPRDSPG
ncbi:MAG: ABC transporter ATP-binding protein [Anaerolineales bacterium]|jgi:lipopolysaccharide transport system ATP-binding protein